MKKATILFFSYLFFTVLILSCKKKTVDLCEGKTCQNNATCTDGKCACDANSYKVKDACITKDANTYYFAGKSYNCIPDTFTLKMGITEQGYNFISCQIPFGTFSGSSSANSQRFKLPDGDSIRAVGVFQKCNVSGIDCTTELLGKIKNTNELNLTVRFFELSNYSKTIDSYKITLKQ
jgi:hypothetical protein